MNSDHLKINESEHQRVPTLGERIGHSVTALVLGFILINIIAFWMFPGIGIGGFYLLAEVHSYTAIVSNIATVFVYTFLILCCVLGWFRGKFFVDRLKSYISYWRFW
ncbi:hypothetical protein [Fodinibius halophilus]|uniref:Uncharacterized protein n=1 Tax=Fodinibius halophilus TaxID=1736908 RepID=A0A6M1T649_9BACT|nr:hypothetical protein [Fodinibius halophilus]NGP86734.1 hypothetical protein [Fodinibius halophilus]